MDIFFLVPSTLNSDQRNVVFENNAQFFFQFFPLETIGKLPTSERSFFDDDFRQNEVPEQLLIKAEIPLKRLYHYWILKIQDLSIFRDFEFDLLFPVPKVMLFNYRKV